MYKIDSWRTGKPGIFKNFQIANLNERKFHFQIPNVCCPGYAIFGMFFLNTYGFRILERDTRTHVGGAGFSSK